MYARGMHRTMFRGLGDDGEYDGEYGGDEGDYGYEDATPIVSDTGFTPISLPTTIALSNTPMGTIPAAAPPLVNYTPGMPLSVSQTPTGVALTQAFKNPDGSPTYDGAPYSATDLLNPYNVTHLFGGLLTTITGGAKPGAPLAPGSVAPASMIGGVQPGTLVLLAGVGLIAYLALGRKS